MRRSYEAKKKNGLKHFATESQAGVGDAVWVWHDLDVKGNCNGCDESLVNCMLHTTVHNSFFFFNMDSIL